MFFKKAFHRKGFSGKEKRQGVLKSMERPTVPNGFYKKRGKGIRHKWRIVKIVERVEENYVRLVECLV